MVGTNRVVVVMPAYNAERTLERTIAEIDRTLVDDILLVDDCSSDRTPEIAKSLGLKVIQHERNLGYGGNQKTCYAAALQLNADIIIMMHPDYQYSPKLVPSIAYMLASGSYDVVLGSRILGGTALKGGMPYYKYLANRILTAVQNIATGKKLSEYHTGLRGYRRIVLESLPFEANSNDFVFDNQFLLQCFLAGFTFGELSCPTRYFDEASSINFRRSLKYGLSCLLGTVCFLLAKGSIYTVPWLSLRKKPKLNLTANRECLS